MVITSILLNACSPPWNNPNEFNSTTDKIYYSSFGEPPKYLDPARSYNQSEGVYTDQIYDAPLQYHYLKRPYTLEPALLENMPEIKYYNKKGNELTRPDNTTLYSEYTLHIKPDVYYQPHPAFATDSKGNYLYHFSQLSETKAFNKFSDFKITGTRTVTSDDFIYQIKRLLNPSVKSPMLSMLSQYIEGADQYKNQLHKNNQPTHLWQDLRNTPITGISKIDDLTFKIRIKGVFPQFIYWLATHFFTPIPWEAERFYSCPGFDQKHFNLNWHPVGTGPFMMTKNDPNYAIILERNPNYRQDYYPSEGEASDLSAGFLKDAGKLLPLIDKAVFYHEKESIPHWRKFFQGYYDRSGESSGNVTNATFDQIFAVSSHELKLSKRMRDKKIRLDEEIRPSIIYVAFNMEDDVVGGYSKKQQKLRQAISIAWDTEEFIHIFMNELAEPAQSPVPPSLLQHTDTNLNQTTNLNFNPYVYDNVAGLMKRKSITYAKQLMNEAGYPGGLDADTGKPLTLYFDTPGTDSSPVAEWRRKQLQKIGIQLEFRVTDYPRFQEKIRSGNSQMFPWGWLADYPDPENFLFLLSENQISSICKCDGSNGANYRNAEFNKLYDKMKILPHNLEHQEIINQMISIVQKDAPWIWGFHNKEYFLSHSWLSNTKRHGISQSTLKYLNIDPKLRHKLQKSWNQPNIWPLIIIGLLLVVMIFSAINHYRKRQKEHIILDKI